MNRRFLRTVSSSSVFLDIVSRINRRLGFSLSINNLAAQSVLLSALLDQTGGRIGVLCDDEDIATALSADCFSLLGEDVNLFPLLYDDTSSVLGFVSQNQVLFTRSFNALTELPSGLFITSTKTAEKRISSPDKNIKSSFVFSKGSSVVRALVLKSLSRWGYEQVDHTSAPNTFSTRGGILDVFPLYANHPIRIEFFGDKIESIRIFNPETQLSEGDRDNFKLLPPVLREKDSVETLFDTLVGCCGFVLYISQNGFSFLGGEKQINIYVEPLQIETSSSVVKQTIVDSALGENNSSDVFLFNPASRGFYRSDEMVEIKSFLSGGFKAPSLGVACFVVPGKKNLKPPKSSAFSGGLRHKKISSLVELRWGDPLVHQDYGIGLYRGLETIGDKNNHEENIKIEYASGGSVFVPLNRFNRVHKYIGLGGSSPKLSRLGSGAWEKQKAITKKSAAEVVDYLINLYKARSTPRGFRYLVDRELTQKLEDGFPFQETKDQLTAINDIYEDMDKPAPMDRLVYGDVGFGKTEVALRASLRAVVSGRAVFFLSPTTVLSDQHYITCKNRLGSLGVNVELLSRFKTKKEQSIIIEKLHKNKIDVLVGTHRLLGEDVPTENLGLLIIDEEHRFGVKHKEKIRRFKNRVDILTLTATPIPRTLQQSLVGIRDTSKIETPPRERLPIQTYVKQFEWPFVIDSIKKEINRNGQVYFLHNDVSGLPFYLEKIQSFFPNASVAIGHGQMPSRDLEKTILSFFNGKIDILLCTTIIESGLDVPNANTIIINNAQMFGLAQLYQIRGRVGRGEIRAFCFLCIPKETKLFPDAYQRLKAIEHHSALGSGYSIAMKDLEIRGAGNLFGYEQSGQISKVGFELYNKILTQEIQKKKGVEDDSKKEKAKIVFGGSAQIEKDFMPLVQDRLYFYQKLSSETTVFGLEKIRSELRDRFGPIPKETETLFKITQIQCSLFPYPISKCNLGPSFTSFVLDAVPNEKDPLAFFVSLQRVLNESFYVFKIEPLKSGSLVVSIETSSTGESFSLAMQFQELFSRVLSS